MTHAGEVAILTRHFPFRCWQAKTYGAQVNYEEPWILCQKVRSLRWYELQGQNTQCQMRAAEGAATQVIECTNIW